MYNKFFEDFNKNSKVFWNAFDVYTSAVKEYVAAEQKNRTVLSDAAWKYFKQAADVKTPEKMIELQVESGKEFYATLQKIADENMELTKSTAAKCSNVVETSMKDIAKAAK